MTDGRSVPLYKRIVRTGRLPRPVAAVVLTASYLLFQGVLYMDPAERRIRLALEAAAMAVLGVPTYAVFGVWAVVAVAGMVHIAHAFVNGHWYGLVKTFGGMDVSPASADAVRRWVAEAAARSPGVAVVLEYGSHVRGVAHASSDLDLRVGRHPGWRAAWQAYRFTWHVRWRSLGQRFPMDIYVFDDPSPGYRMAADETPRVLYSDQTPQSGVK